MLRQGRFKALQGGDEEAVWREEKNEAFFQRVIRYTSNSDWRNSERKLNKVYLGFAEASLPSIFYHPHGKEFRHIFRKAKKRAGSLQG